jgi:hypothetical protein
MQPALVILIRWLLTGGLAVVLFSSHAYAESVSEARQLFANKTIMTFDSSHGTQVEYLDPGGAAFLWYPGNSVIVPSEWRIAAAETDAIICFRYGSNTYNPATRQAGGNWECRSASRQAARAVERTNGDPFGLARRRAVPYVLSRERATMAELKSHLP